MALTPKQKLFIDEYLIDLNATQAAIRAGYSEKTARKIGQENLTKPDIQSVLQKRMKDRERRTELSQDWVLENLRTVVDRSLQAEEIKLKDGSGTGEFRFNAAGANKALELIGKHLGMWKDKVEVSGEITSNNPLSELSTDELRRFLEKRRVSGDG